ncbi:MAG: TonB C-terminal domain-containing protein [Azonexus sp.]|jgi:colicin import membrane protein|nr:TonB C-terminal domain-containing protein [Azonexus sp.]
MPPDNAQEPGKKKALTLTLLVHAALIGALFLGVQWKRSQPETMDVELWSPTPQQATRVEPPAPPPKPVEAPKKPEPPPLKVETPKKPDIAVKEDKKKPEPPKPQPPKPEPPKAKPEAKPETRPAPPVDAFKDALAREESERQATAEQNRRAAIAEAERKAAGQRGLETYAGKIRGKVRGNTVLPPNISGNPEAVFSVTQLPGGEVLAVRLKRSSGNQALDAAIERAILKSSPLPKPDDPALFQRELEIKYKPFDE